MRRRYLGLTSEPSAPPLEAKEMIAMYADLHQQVATLQAYDAREITLAFTSGFLCFVVALAGLKIFVAFNSRSRALEGSFRTQSRLRQNSITRRSGGSNSIL